MSQDYLERARGLAPLIESSADEAEQVRQLPPPLAEALHGAGLFRMLLPRSLGGGEVDPVTFVTVIEEIARHDASTAWSLCQVSGCSMVSAYLDAPVAAEIFGHGGVLAWGPGPGARAVADDDGYRISGTWNFASGGRHATWFGGYCPIYEADGTPRRRADGTPDGRTMLFPASRATMHDVWHVIGLRGTGSDSFSVSDLHVPHRYSVSRDDPTERRDPGRLYCFPSGSMYASGFACVALGIARTSLDALVALAGEKTPRGYKHTLRESAVVQSQVAQAEARLGSARTYLLASLDEIWRDRSARRSRGRAERSVEAGRVHALSLEQRMRIRLAATYGIHAAKDVVDFAYQTAGATAVFQGSGFERRFRDMHAVTQQLQGRMAHFETVGCFLLGLEPDTTWL